MAAGPGSEVAGPLQLAWVSQIPTLHHHPPDHPEHHSDFDQSLAACRATSMKSSLVSPSGPAARCSSGGSSGSSGGGGGALVRRTLVHVMSGCAWSTHWVPFPCPNPAASFPELELGAPVAGVNGNRCSPLFSLLQRRPDRQVGLAC